MVSGFSLDEFYFVKVHYSVRLQLPDDCTTVIVSSAGQDGNQLCGRPAVEAPWSALMPSDEVQQRVVGLLTFCIKCHEQSKCFKGTGLISSACLRCHWAEGLWLTWAIVTCSLAEEGMAAAGSEEAARAALADMGLAKEEHRHLQQLLACTEMLSSWKRKRNGLRSSKLTCKM